MSDLTDDQVRALKDEVMTLEHLGGVWVTADDYLQARADAAAAQALMVERAVAPLTDEEAYSAALSHRHDLGLLPPRDQELECNRAKWWHEALSHRIRSLAPDAGTAELAKLRGEIADLKLNMDADLKTMVREGAQLKALAADLAQANQRARDAYLRGLLDAASHLRATIPAEPENARLIEGQAQMLEAMATREATKAVLP